MRIKLAITDDHPVVTNGLKNILTDVEQIEIVAICKTAGELLAKIATIEADILLLDLQLEDGSEGHDTVRKVLKIKPKIQIIVFSSNDTIFHVKKMLKAGCTGYMLKDADEDLLLKGIETVYKGTRFLSPAIEAALLDDMFLNKPPAGKKIALTQREKEILELVVKEYTNQEIAAKLFLGLSTIEFHRTSMFQKLGVKNTAGLVRVAVQNGLV